ncbi:response regulator [Pseudomonas sp. SAICEU22]|uniref:Response regulator n=1 Tax=Pseudomonas agronomica TaxID=2979328 RepID=A0ABT3F8U8_9PSED|nr:response regulator [Pseudomonas agronomica]MCW1245528.1 response regulator [Pseudomonas agronomica]
MPNKALRIMIADTEHYQRMKLERLFNHQGYFRIAPVSDVEELLTLVEYGSEPFDLVMVNAGLAKGTLDLPGYLRDNPQVRHGMIYNAQPSALGAVPVAHGACLHKTHAQLPDLALLQRLMTSIDPPAEPFTQSFRQGHGT